MITYRRQDLFKEIMCRVIVHGVNCQGVMGSGPKNAGIGGEIKKRYPTVFEAYERICNKNKNSSELLGLINVVQVEKGDLPKYVINAFTQHRYGSNDSKYVSYDAIDDCMREVRNWWHFRKIDTTIGMPKIGAGLAGGDWGVIEQIIRHRLDDVPVCIYEKE